MYSTLLIWKRFLFHAQSKSSAIVNLPNSQSTVNMTLDHGSLAWSKQKCIDHLDWMGAGRPSSFKVSDCGQAFKQIKAEAGEIVFDFLTIGA